MTRKMRVLMLALAASVVAPLGAVGVTTVGAPVASADQTVSYYATTGNGSDPDMERCTYNGQTGYCLYTSQDMGQGGNSGNSYPMYYTQGYFSTDAVNWTYEGVVMSESTYTNVGWTPAGANHLWAPTMAEAANGWYFLYVPDITDVNAQHTSSFIGVSVSFNGPFGPFYPWTRIFGSSGVDGGYASDPDVLNDNGTHYLVYANGDGSNCGGLSEATLNSSMNGLSGSSQQIQISGIGALGNCGYGHPYMEGPSLYRTDSWGLGVPGPYLLEFAAKPSSTPAGCAANFGEPGTANEVIAYATSSSPTGPFTYQGILMCGSSTEYTDQASIMPVPVAGGHEALAMVYHDGPSGTHNRKLHAQCLAFGGGKFAATMRPVWLSQGWVPDFSSCMNGYQYYTWGFQSTSNGQMLTAMMNTANYANGELAVNGRIAMGQYEGFDTIESNGYAHAPQYATGYNGWLNVNLGSYATGEYAEDVGTGGTLIADSPYLSNRTSLYLSYAGNGVELATIYGSGAPTMIAGGLGYLYENWNYAAQFLVMHYYVY